MRTKVLRGGSFEGKAELLMQLSIPLGTLASTFALADVSRDHRRTLTPGPLALHQAFNRHGLDIRRAVAAAWQLDDLLLGNDDEGKVGEEYAGLRHALVWRWLDRPLPHLVHCDADRLTATLAEVSPRLTDRAA